MLYEVITVYENTQSVVLEQGFSFISDFDGEAVGSISFEGNNAPMGVMNEKIMFAPYFNKDDITAFAVAKMSYNFV